MKTSPRNRLKTVRSGSRTDGITVILYRSDSMKPLVEHRKPIHRFWNRVIYHGCKTCSGLYQTAFAFWNRVIYHGCKTVARCRFCRRRFWNRVIYHGCKTTGAPSASEAGFWNRVIYHGCKTLTRILALISHFGTGCFATVTKLHSLVFYVLKPSDLPRPQNSTTTLMSTSEF